WDELTQQMGYWVDLDDPYITFEPEYIESCWALLKKLYDKGLLYKGYTIQPYSPAAGTGLSSHELNQPGTYKDVKDTTIVAQFKVVRDAVSEKLFVGGGEGETYILAWTTTPWTLPANTGLAVGKNIQYVAIRTFNPYTYDAITVVLAKNLVGRYFASKEYSEADLALADESNRNYEEKVAAWLLSSTNATNREEMGWYVHGKPAAKRGLPWYQVAEFTGADLVGIHYERLFSTEAGFPHFEGEENAFRVIPGDFVTTEDGTGIVHISPTFGADDFRVAQLNGIPALMVADDQGKLGPIVDRTGRYVTQMGEFGGRWVKNYDGHDQSGADYKTLDESIAIRMRTN
ncbi:MAG: isoleucine--tRNA ligase, partial [Hymenobacter sp.]